MPRGPWRSGASPRARPRGATSRSRLRPRVRATPIEDRATAAHATRAWSLSWAHASRRLSAIRSAVSPSARGSRVAHFCLAPPANASTSRRAAASGWHGWVLPRAASTSSRSSKASRCLVFLPMPRALASPAGKPRAASDRPLARPEAFRTMPRADRWSRPAPAAMPASTWALGRRWLLESTGAPARRRFANLLLNGPRSSAPRPTPHGLSTFVSR